LAQGLGIVAAQAERLKVERAHLGEEGTGMVELKSVNGQAVKLVQETEIGDIVSARIDEWMSLVEQRLAEISWSKGPPGGVVMVGGSSLLRGLPHRIERAWGWPVRLGAPTQLAGLSDLARSPGYAVVVGLARVGIQDGLGFGRETLWTRLTQAWFRTWG
jgi:cell division protein FtsA